MKILWPNYQGKNRKNDLLQNVSIKNPFYSEFYAVPMQKTVLISSITFKSNGNGNDYLYLAFLAQNGEGTVRER